MMKNIVVGATGYIGKELFRQIPKKSALGTSSKGSEELIKIDLMEPEKVDYRLIESGDVVFLTAAISAPDICANNQSLARNVNVTGTSAFIKRAIDCGARVLFFSSDTVYGELSDTFNERALSNPAGEYAEMKHEVEQFFSGNASFKAIRLSYVFSRADKFSRYLIGCAEREEEAELFHPFYRAIVHRDDVVRGALTLAARWDEVPEQIINFGGPHVISRIEFAKCLRDTYLHNLRFKVTEPDPDFFNNRPRIIAMISPVFSRLLGGPPRSIYDAARIEFSSSLNY